MTFLYRYLPSRGKKKTIPRFEPMTGEPEHRWQNQNPNRDVEHTLFDKKETHRETSRIS
jgi:hypothetical protein